MFRFIIFTAVLITKTLESNAYGLYPYSGKENRPVLQDSVRTNNPRQEFRPSANDAGINTDRVWYPDSSYLNKPKLHGPQIDINSNNFRPAVQIPQFAAGGVSNNRPSRQGRRPQQSFQNNNSDNNRPNLFLPPVTDDPNDVFIFDRPTSSRPRPGTNGTPTPSSTTASTTTQNPVTNCDCPSTPEFNPVCGSNDVTYTNPGKLKCAVFCGLDVKLKYRGTCITTTEAPPTSTTRLQR